MRKLRADHGGAGRRYLRAGAAAGAAATGAVALVVQTRRSSTAAGAGSAQPQMADPKELFALELGNVLHVERALTKTLPRLAAEATHRPLQTALLRHVKETGQHAKNVEAAFESIGRRPKAGEGPGVEAIQAQHDEFVSEQRPSRSVLDLYLTGAAARTEHYEIAAYTNLVTMADALGEKKAATLLRKNLRQEQAALKKVTDIASKLNAKLAETPDQ